MPFSAFGEYYPSTSKEPDPEPERSTDTRHKFGGWISWLFVLLVIFGVVYFIWLRNTGIINIAASLHLSGYKTATIKPLTMSIRFPASFYNLGHPLFENPSLFLGSNKECSTFIKASKSEGKCYIIYVGYDINSDQGITTPGIGGFTPTNGHISPEVDSTIKDYQESDVTIDGLKGTKVTYWQNINTDFSHGEYHMLNYSIPSTTHPEIIYVVRANVYQQYQQAAQEAIEYIINNIKLPSR